MEFTSWTRYFRECFLISFIHNLATFVTKLNTSLSGYYSVRSLLPFNLEITFPIARSSSVYVTFSNSLNYNIKLTIRELIFLKSLKDLCSDSSRTSHSCFRSSSVLWPRPNPKWLSRWKETVPLILSMTRNFLRCSHRLCRLSILSGSSWATGGRSISDYRRPLYEPHVIIETLARWHISVALRLQNVAVSEL